MALLCSLEALSRARGHLPLLGMLYTVHRCVDSCLLLRLMEAWQETLHVGLDLNVTRLSSRWEG